LTFRWTFLLGVWFCLCMVSWWAFRAHFTLCSRSRWWGVARFNMA